MRNVISKKEKLIGFGVAIYAIVAFLVMWLPHWGSTQAIKGFTPLEVALEGVAIAGVFALVVAIGKRLYIGFAGLALGFGPWSKLPELALPAIFYAAFVGFRYVLQPKSQRLAAEAAKPAPSGRAARGSRSSGPAESARYTSPKKRKTKPDTATGRTLGSLGRLGPTRGSGTDKADRK